MTEHFENGWEAEKAGEYGIAGMYYALDACERLIRTEFEAGRKTRISAAGLLLSISCDMRAQKIRRARYMGGILEKLLHEIRDTAEDEILSGLAIEWLGDSRLMLGENDVVEWYSRAEEHYVDAKAVENRGFDEEVLYAHQAVTGFLASRGESLPENSKIDFNKRVRSKIEIAREMTD